MAIISDRHTQNTRMSGPLFIDDSRGELTLVVRDDEAYEQLNVRLSFGEAESIAVWYLQQGLLDG